MKRENKTIEMAKIIYLIRSFFYSKFGIGKRKFSTKARKGWKK